MNLSNRTMISASGTTNIDIEAYAQVIGMRTDDSGQSFDRGYIAPDAGITFALIVERAGEYEIGVSHASATADASVRVLVDGTEIAGLALPATGSWSSYRTMRSAPVKLPQGQVRLEFVAASAGWNFGGLALTSLSTATPIPYQLGFIANDATTTRDLASIAGWLGRKLDCCGGTMTLSGWWAGGIPSDVDVCGVSVPMLTLPGWQSFTAVDMAEAASGAYDEHYVAAARALAGSGARIRSVRPGWEMNGNWYPWSIGNPTGRNNNAENYVAAFRRMADILRQYLPGVLIEFCTAWAWRPYTYPSGSAVGNAGTPGDYWPGRDYVDIVSMDFYESNVGHGWQKVQSGPGAQFDLDWLVAFAERNDLKIGLSEWGAAYDDGAFITGAASWMASLGSRFVYAVYSSYQPADQVVRPGSNPAEQAAWIAAWRNTVYSKA